ncbi:hypothetical protein LshimejAT787_0201790 [Lyophyllum shimeji]|uniref:Uncharacterized protein n=1 Tax=Lyophyllum shimeji TaxID=47721 RepID=A0A9P3UHX4_LYOSH|nr:hypothetical protein LshimejAT787_0201790 [Lyophyllum shimeji]
MSTALVPCVGEPENEMTRYGPSALSTKTQTHTDNRTDPCGVFAEPEYRPSVNTHYAYRWHRRRRNGPIFSNVEAS